VDATGCFAVLFVVLFLYPIPFYCVFLCVRKIDPYFYICQYFIPFSSTTLKLYTLLGARIVVASIFWFEYVRCAYILCLMPLMVISSAIRELETLSNSKVSRKNTKIYTQIQILFKTCHHCTKMGVWWLWLDPKYFCRLKPPS